MATAAARRQEINTARGQDSMGDACKGVETEAQMEEEKEQITATDYEFSLTDQIAAGSGRVGGGFTESSAPRDTTQHRTQRGLGASRQSKGVPISKVSHCKKQKM